MKEENEEIEWMKEEEKEDEKRNQEGKTKENDYIQKLEYRSRRWEETRYNTVF